MTICLGFSSVRRGAMHYTPVEGLLARTTHDAQIRCDHPEFSVCVMRAAKKKLYM